MKFKHNQFYDDAPDVTPDTYNYVTEYKKQLLQSITSLLDDVGIKYVISHGNLIEYVRGKPIYHDDDIDIRYDERDFAKWIEFTKTKKSPMLLQYNLRFDSRFNSEREQKMTGLHCNLINFKNTTDIVVYPRVFVNCDLVCSKLTTTKCWMNYDINFDDLRKIKYYDIDTYCPNEADTNRVLSTQYGENYLIPNKPDPF
jgi:hypothetical protein